MLLPRQKIVGTRTTKSVSCNQFQLFRRIRRSGLIVPKALKTQRPRNCSECWHLRTGASAIAGAAPRPLRRMVAVRLDRRLAPLVDPSDVVQEALVDASQKLMTSFATARCRFIPGFVGSPRNGSSSSIVATSGPKNEVSPARNDLISPCRTIRR